MNAFNDVNIAGACILTTTECAVRMGIPRDKWIFPLGGGRAEDSKDSEFPYSEPAIRHAEHLINQLTFCTYSLGPSQFLHKPGNSFCPRSLFAFVWAYQR